MVKNAMLLLRIKGFILSRSIYFGRSGISRFILIKATRIKNIDERRSDLLYFFLLDTKNPEKKTDGTELEANQRLNALEDLI